MKNFLGSFFNITLQEDFVVEEELEKDSLLFLLFSAVDWSISSMSL